MKTLTLSDQIQRLHQPVESVISAIFQNNPSCQECKHAWPCKTYQLAQGANPND